MKDAFIAVWRYRHFIRSGIQGDFIVRFARSRLGTTWSILHPLAQSAIYVIVLAEVVGAKLPNATSTLAYPVFLLGGMAAWSLFQEIITRSMTVFIDYGNVLKKVAFPRLCLPIIIWGGTLLNHLLLLLAIAVVMGCLGHPATAAWLYLPVGIVLISGLGFAFGIFLGLINVVCRDVGHVASIVLQVWFWLTPVVYPFSAAPENLKRVLMLNPMLPLVQLYQDVMLRQAAPDLLSVLPVAVLILVVGLATLGLFRRASGDLVDAL
jgi:lipopolysaccharide transport system permease protein